MTTIGRLQRGRAARAVPVRKAHRRPARLAVRARPGRAGRSRAGLLRRRARPMSLYVLLSGTLVMSRRIGDDDVEVVRTSSPGVYAGAFFAYLGDRMPQVYINSVRVTEPSRFFVLDSPRFAELMTTWFPMATHLLEGPALRHQEHPGSDRPARAAARARLAVGRPHPRAEQSGVGGGQGHVGAARASRRNASQARRDRGRSGRPGSAGQPDRVPGQSG